MKTLSTALALVLALGAGTAMAANARNPYGNIDRRNDKGNDTGDSKVDALNQQQLDAARSQNGYIVTQPGVGAPVFTPGPPPPGAVYTAPPPGYTGAAPAPRTGY